MSQNSLRFNSVYHCDIHTYLILLNFLNLMKLIKLIYFYEGPRTRSAGILNERNAHLAFYPRVVHILPNSYSKKPVADDPFYKNTRNITDIPNPCIKLAFLTGIECQFIPFSSNFDNLTKTMESSCNPGYMICYVCFFSKFKFKFYIFIKE